MNKITLLLALGWILIAALFGRSCGGAFLARVSANAALGLYNAAAELFAPQLVYVGEDGDSGIMEDLIAAVLPSFSYYQKILWYEAQSEGTGSYEMLAAAENAAAVGEDGASGDHASGSSSGGDGWTGDHASGSSSGSDGWTGENVSDSGSGSDGRTGENISDSGSGSDGRTGENVSDSGSGSDGRKGDNATDDSSGGDGSVSGTVGDGSSNGSVYSDGTSSEGGIIVDSSSLSADELAEIETMAQAASDGGSAADGSTSVNRGAAADGFDVLADLVKSITVDREKLLDFDYLKSTFYQVDSTTSISSDLLDAEELLAVDMTLKERSDNAPQILIYHTHSQEGYADSVEGDSSTTVVGVGEYLMELLTEEYGYQVLHHTGEYDVNDRDHAYTNAAPAIEALLEEYPSIQVIIDLHRDGVAESTHLVTVMNGKPTAQIMFFNGLSHTTTLGDISWLPNPYIEENLAFSFQMQLAAAEYYPGLTRRIYLKGYRYNMHFLPQSMLVEVGAQNNTLEEAMNAMEPLAALLDYVLSGANR